MYARFGIVQVKPGKIEEFVRIFRDEMMPAARVQKGFKGVMVFTDPATNQVVSFSLWETEADAQAMEAQGFNAQIHKVQDLIADIKMPLRYLQLSHQE